VLAASNEATPVVHPPLKRASSNEKKMSDGHRERAWLAVKGSKPRET
jgi:hypothetical protein